MAWQVYRKEEILPTWRGKWKWSNYASVYTKYERYEISTCFLMHVADKNRLLKKAVKNADVKRTHSCFVWFETKDKKKIELSKTNFYKKKLFD